MESLVSISLKGIAECFIKHSGSLKKDVVVSSLGYLDLTDEQQ